MGRYPEQQKIALIFCQMIGLESAKTAREIAAPCENPPKYTSGGEDAICLMIEAADCLIPVASWDDLEVIPEERADRSYQARILRPPLRVTGRMGALGKRQETEGGKWKAWEIADPESPRPCNKMNIGGGGGKERGRIGD